MSAIIQGVHDAVSYLQVDPSAPAGSGDPTKSINVVGILKFFAVFLVPPLIGALAVVVISHSFSGAWAKAMQKIAVAIVGLVLLAAAASLFAFGSGLVDVLFK